MRKKQIFIAVLLFMFIGALQAQEKLSLDLAGAKQHALEYNRTIKSSSLAVTQSQENSGKPLPWGCHRLMPMPTM